MLEDKIKDEIAFAVQSVYGKNISNKDIEVTRPKEFGDFATNISFKLAKEVAKNPKEIAEELAKKLSTEAFEKVDAVNGFLNFYLKKEHYYEILSQILSKKEKYADLEDYKGKKVQVEFISANPTGPLTLANGRGGYGGDVLANVFTKAGANVQREYYVNDGGNQVKILGESILVAAGLLEKEDDFYKGEYIEEWVKEHKKEIEELKDKPFELGKIASEDVVNKHIKPSVKKMGIDFDNWFSEYKLIQSGEIEKAIDRLKEKGLTYEKDGAVWFKSTEFGDDKDRVIVKSDGLYTYLAGDAAYHWDKFAVRKFDKVVNFWGADHHGDIARVQGAVFSFGFGGKLDVVILQLVRLIKDGKEFRMSKRKGTYVTMDDLLELIGGTYREASDVARFFFLMRSFNTHMDFDLDLAKERSEKNPVFYVKYAFARLSGILRNAKDLKLPKSDITKLAAPEEIELIDQLSQLESVVRSVLMFGDYPVHFLPFYAIETARKFHAFYDKRRVIDEDDLEMTAARLKLVEATQTVLKIVMEDLIGVEAPERM
jgi:arginyl-tRNA synthetase